MRTQSTTLRKLFSLSLSHSPSLFYSILSIVHFFYFSIVFPLFYRLSSFLYSILSILYFLLLSTLSILSILSILFSLFSILSSSFFLTLYSLYSILSLYTFSYTYSILFSILSFFVQSPKISQRRAGFRTEGWDLLNTCPWYLRHNWETVATSLERFPQQISN